MPLSKFQFPSRTGKSFASAWHRTMRTPVLADSGQTSALAVSASCEIVEISDSLGGMPLPTPLFLIELL